MTVRNVKKNLVGQQDLLPGVGPYNQIRRGTAVVLDGPAKSFIQLWKEYARGFYAGTFEDGCTVSTGQVVVSLTAGIAYKYIGACTILVGPATVINSNWETFSPFTLEDLKALLASAVGSSLIGHVNEPGTAERTVKAVLSDRPVSPQDYGGTDDYNGSTGTNNLSAFAQAIQAINLAGGGMLYLPKTNTGKYFINGDDPTQVTSDMFIHADTGVELYIIYSGGTANSPLVNTNLKVNRELKITFVNFGFSSSIGSKVLAKLADTMPTVNNGDGVYTEPVALAGANFSLYRLSNTFTTIAATATTSDVIAYNGDAVPTIGVIPSYTGLELSSLISSPVGGVFLAGVVTVAGYSYIAQDPGTQSVKFIEATSGSATIVLGVPYALLDQQRDMFNNSVLTVKILSDYSYSVLVNGLSLGSFSTRSPIIAAGFGSENINAQVSLSQFYYVKGLSYSGSKPLKIIVLGDSITDNNVQHSWAKYMQLVLATAGVQVAEVLNIAVGGQTAAQQYALLQNIGSGYDLCLVQVGVNDIQGSTAYASFITTMQNIVTYAKQIGATPIVGIPTQYYSKAEAAANGQAGGQNTANNAQGHTYRALLVRAVAAAGGLVNLEPAKGFGAMTAKWLSLAPYAENDKLVVDNIHPTPFGSMMLAQGWARSVLGWLNRANLSAHESFYAMPSAWLTTGFGLVNKPDIKGRELRGLISLHATINNDGAVALTLPKYLWRNTTKIVTVPGVGADNLPKGTCNMYIGPNGNCYFFNLPAATTKISLDGVIL